MKLCKTVHGSSTPLYQGYIILLQTAKLLSEQ